MSVVPDASSACGGRRLAAAACAIAAGLRARVGASDSSVSGRTTDSVLDEVRAVALPAREEAAGDRLLARVEVDGVGAVGVQVAQEAVLPAAEREEGHRRRDADVDADHPGLDFVAEAADGRAVLGEYRGAIAEARCVDDRDRVVER